MFAVWPQGGTTLAGKQKSQARDCQQYPIKLLFIHTRILVSACGSLFSPCAFKFSLSILCGCHPDSPGAVGLLSAHNAAVPSITAEGRLDTSSFLKQKAKNMLRACRRLFFRMHFHRKCSQREGTLSNVLFPPVCVRDCSWLFALKRLWVSCLFSKEAQRPWNGTAWV